MKRHEVFALIEDERAHQIRKHGRNTPSNENLSDTVKLGILTEELLEANIELQTAVLSIIREITDNCRPTAKGTFPGHDLDRLAREIVQTITVGTAWLEGLPVSPEDLWRPNCWMCDHCRPTTDDRMYCETHEVHKNDGLPLKETCFRRTS